VGEVIPHRRERTHVGEQDKSPPPSPTRPEPSATIEAARAAAELMSSQARTTGDGGADGGATHGAAREDDGHKPTEGADGKDARAVNLNPNVSRSRPPLPPRRRLDLRSGRAAQATKRRRFQEMASAAGFDVDMRILDTMDWEDWTEGGGSSSDTFDKEEPQSDGRWYLGRWHGPATGIMDRLKMCVISCSAFFTCALMAMDLAKLYDRLCSCSSLHAW